jgi:hypothetical protein
MNMKGIFLLLLALVALSACATIPTGPSVMVWPGPGKPFEVFQSDDAGCRQWASQQVGGQVESANQTLASGAAVGTILGAGLGAAIGAGSGNAGAAVGFGAASGAIMGTTVASGPYYGAQGEIQRRYDHAYLQCMYMRGNQVPGARTYRRAVPSPSSAYPPPPAGTYPPPPPPESR